MKSLVCASIAALMVAGMSCLGVQTSTRGQFPAPMVERTRVHKRIQPAEYPGVDFTVDDVLPKPVDVYLADRVRDVGSLDLVFFFHSVPYITQQAAESSGVAFIGVTVQLGSGSSVYNAPFVDSTAFPRLVDSVMAGLASRGYDRNRNRIILAAFSAGYGAVRRILSQPENRKMVDAVLLLDAIYASYVPEGTVLAEGGIIRAADVETFLSFAEETSMPGSGKRFVITHSEGFPGTFVSTTETTDWILEQMGLKRTPVLQWGPMGMQQVSETRKGNFSVLGFAGNSGIDHGDHLHAFGDFLRLVAWGDRPDH